MSCLIIITFISVCCLSRIVSSVSNSSITAPLPLPLPLLLRLLDLPDPLLPLEPLLPLPLPLSLSYGLEDLLLLPSCSSIILCYKDEIHLWQKYNKALYYKNTALLSYIHKTSDYVSIQLQSGWFMEINPYVNQANCQELKAECRTHGCRFETSNTRFSHNFHIQRCTITSMEPMKQNQAVIEL